jgi:AraC family transcriptional regulator, regulatory protein of adaptative response / methylated-DNA-[protein]-cysteine methyltransferase
MKLHTHPAQDQRSTVERDPRWAAVLRRDPTADKKFVYAVRTTGVYCRPSSPTRRPKPENVEFFDSPEAAQTAGYRPSRRAADQATVATQHVALISDACRYIETAETLPTLNELAQRVKMSPYHFHRVFKSTTGLTPKSYAEAHRARKMRNELSGKESITDAIYDAGFNSNSRFYEASNHRLGMRPKDYRAGGANTEILFAVGECSLGSIVVAQSERGVCAILMGDDPGRLVRDLQDQFPKAHLVGADASFERIVAKVVGLVDAPALGLDLPLDIQGTAFQERVWQALREIPAGTTASYSDIAQRIGMPKAVRAVAQACGANHLAVAIPCHRVVRSDGQLSGYRWGVERKRTLLDRETPQS